MSSLEFSYDIDCCSCDEQVASDQWTVEFDGASMDNVSAELGNRYQELVFELAGPDREDLIIGRREDGQFPKTHVLCTNCTDHVKGICPLCKRKIGTEGLIPVRNKQLVEDLFSDVEELILKQNRQFHGVSNDDRAACDECSSELTKYDIELFIELKDLHCKHAYG